MTALATIQPQDEQTVRNILSVLSDANGLTIKTDAGNRLAGDLVRRIASSRRDLEALQKHLLEPVKEQEKRIRDFIRPNLARIEEGERAVKGEITRFAIEQQRVREEADRRLAAAAEKERLERERLAEQHRAKAEAATTDAQRARYEALAEAQEEKAAAVMPATVAEPERVSGVSMRDNWAATVFDLRALCQAVVDGSVDIEAILPNQPYLNGLARALKGKLNIPGVRPVNNPSVSARGI